MRFNQRAKTSPKDIDKSREKEPVCESEFFILSGNRISKCRFKRIGFYNLFAGSERCNTLQMKLIEIALTRNKRQILQAGLSSDLRVQASRTAKKLLRDAHLFGAKLTAMFLSIIDKIPT